MRMAGMGTMMKQVATQRAAESPREEKNAGGQPSSSALHPTPSSPRHPVRVCRWSVGICWSGKDPHREEERDREAEKGLALLPVTKGSTYSLTIEKPEKDVPTAGPGSEWLLLTSKCCGTATEAGRHYFVSISSHRQVSCVLGNEKLVPMSFGRGRT